VYVYVCACVCECVFAIWGGVMGVAGRGDILGGRGGVGGPRRKRDSRRHQEGDTFTSFDTLLHTHTHTHARTQMQDSHTHAHF
jgi:hypothetical protein